MEETPFEAIPTFTPQRRQGNRKPAFLILAIIIIILLLLGFKAVTSPKTSTPTPTPTPSVAVVTPTETPTPTVNPSLTPTPVVSPTINPIDKTSGLDRSKLSVTIQNGSGAAGVAAKGVTVLKDLGYDVVESDNADNFNYTNVTIQVKVGKKDFLSLLKKDLGFTYTIGSATSDLPDSSSSDALVIIGK